MTLVLSSWSVSGHDKVQRPYGDSDTISCTFQNIFILQAMVTACSLPFLWVLHRHICARHKPRLPVGSYWEGVVYIIIVGVMIMIDSHRSIVIYRQRKLVLFKGSTVLFFRFNPLYYAQCLPISPQEWGFLFIHQTNFKEYTSYHPFITEQVIYIHYCFPIKYVSGIILLWTKQFPHLERAAI